jgi:AraC-like DNA-binding protein
MSFDAYFLSYDYLVTKPPALITVSATLLSQTFIYLDSLMVDIDAFLHSLDVDPASVKSPDMRIPIETYLRIQDEAAVFLNDPCFGLHVGEFAEAGSWSILGYIMMNCRNVGEAFEKSARYSRIIGNLIEVRIERKLNKGKLIFFTSPHAPEMSRHCFDTSFSTTICMMRNFTGVNLHPLEVTSNYIEPKSRSEYERIFQCPIVFGHKENSFTIDTSVFNTPILMANPSLLEQFEKYAQEFLAELDQRNEHTHIVTKIIIARLDDEALSIEKVAKEMSISVRTLQKRLEEEGVIFSDLLRDIRHRLARKYLRENYSVEQITYLLGFSEPSAFRKVFKKWSGVTPREYRERSFSASTQI